MLYYVELSNPSGMLVKLAIAFNKLIIVSLSWSYWDIIYKYD